jgi:hypothetical protein
MMLHSCAERNWQIIRCDKRATYEIVKGKFSMTSFMWQVLFAKCTCVYAKFFHDKFSYDKFYLLVWMCQKKVFIAAMTEKL